MSQTKAQLIDNLVQPITGALGSASAPTFSFTSDPNTGLYSPGADQLALTTGGTGRLFIDSSGRVGIGTGGSQLSNFHVEGTSRFVAANSALFNGTTGTYSTWLYNGTAVGDIGTGNQVFAGGSNTDFGITARSTTSLVFGTNTTERMRLDSSGRLGIGTSSPSTILHINTSVNNSSDYYLDAGATALIRNDNASGVTSLRLASSGNSTSALVWGGSGSETLIFANRQNERLRIDSSGRVGIGTTSPGKPLDVRGAGSANVGSFSDGTRGIDIATTASGGSIQTYDQNQTLDLKTFGTTTNSINFTVGSTERARIDSSGRLLIGASSSQAGAGANDLLQVVGPIQIVSSTNIYSRLVPSSTGLNIISNAYPANVGTTQNIKMSIGSSGGGGPNDVLLLQSTGRHLIGQAVTSTLGIAYPLEVISSSSAGQEAGLASYYGLISGSGYAVNHGSDNDNTVGISFELSTHNIGGWRPASFFLQVARGKGDATLSSGAWYIYTFIMYAGSAGTFILQDSGGSTANFTISATSTTGSFDGGKQTVIVKISVNSGSFSDAYTTMVVNLNTYNQIVRSERTSS